ncbi:MAG: glycine betaine ABC transporter substrate-binding protein [Pseudomonadota bacterium]
MFAAAPVTSALADGHAKCGDVTMAEMNWASAELMANVDKFILENGYGCNVELVQGGTTQIFASMNEKGNPEIAGELWVNAVREPLNKAVEEGRMEILVKGPITELGEGWWITPAFAEKHPELDSVEKVLERPDLFPDSEDPSKGAFIGCPAGWGCQLANASLFRAFDMEAKGWRLVDPGSAAGLDGSMAKAAERGEPWFGYYWSPTALIGKYNMKLLKWDTPWGGSENWDGCIVKPEDECADPKPSSYTESEVNTVVTKSFLEGGSEVAKGYLEKRVFPGAVMNGMLVYMTDEQASGADATIEFLKKHEDVWTSWVAPEVAEKVKAAVASS